MPELFNTATGANEDLPHEAVTAAIKSGSYLPTGDPGTKIPVINPDGKPALIDASQAQEAFKKGYIYETPAAEQERAKRESWETGKGELKSLTIGAVRGATLGLSDYVTKKLDKTGHDIDALRESHRFNPGVETTGEIAATVLPSLLSGGTSTAAGIAKTLGPIPSAVSKLGTLTAEGVTKAVGESVAKKLAGKAVAAAAGSAVEGGLYEAGHLISEEALGDTPMTAEKVMAHIGMGVLLGGALGAGTAAVEAGVSAGARKIGEKVQELAGGEGGLKEKVQKFAAERALKATGARGADVNKLSEEKAQQVGRDILDYQLENGEKLLTGTESHEQLYEKLKQAHGEAGERLGAFRKKVDEFVKANGAEELPGAMAAEGKLQVGGRGLNPDVGEYLNQVRSDIIEPLQSSNVASIRDRAKKVFRELGDVQEKWEAGHKFSLEELTQTRQDLARIVYPKAVKGLPPAPPEHVEELRQAERMLEDFITRTTDRAAEAMGGQAGEYSKLRQTYESIRKAKDLAEKAVGQNLGNRAISLTDYITGATMAAGKAAGDPFTYLQGAAGAFFNKVARERGSSFMAVAANRLSKLAALEKTSSSIQAALDKGLERLVTGAGQAVRKAVVPASLDVLHSVSFGASQPPADSKMGRLDAYHARLTELSDLVGSPQTMADRLAHNVAGIADVAPNMAQYIQTAAVKGASFLLQKAPKDPNPPDLMGSKWVPSASDLNKWERYVAAAHNPIGAIQDLASGVGTAEGVETLRTLYPSLYQNAVQQIVQRLGEHKEDIPYARRVQLSLLLGAPVDRTMRPAFIHNMQALYAEGQPQNPQQPSGGKSARGAAKMKFADRAQSGAQRIEAR